MIYKVHHAVVIGAGTMGAAIAAHLANAGVPVKLLDIVPRELTPEEEEKGLTLNDKVVRNRIVQKGLQSAIKSRPASFFTTDHASLISIGNLEDDFNIIADTDWVIEVIIENLEIKRKLMRRIDEIRSPGTIVSTNTSGIPVVWCHGCVIRWEPRVPIDGCSVGSCGKVPHDALRGQCGLSHSVHERGNGSREDP